MNIGTDLLYIPKLKEMIQKYPHFIDKVYTSKEQELAQERKDPIYFYASRFAAKEAIIKATNGLYDFQEIEILKEDSGKPIVFIHQKKEKIELSLSFDHDYVIAFCISLIEKK